MIGVKWTFLSSLTRLSVDSEDRSLRNHETSTPFRPGAQVVAKKRWLSLIRFMRVDGVHLSPRATMQEGLQYFKVCLTIIGSFWVVKCGLVV